MNNLAEREALVRIATRDLDAMPRDAQQKRARVALRKQAALEREELKTHIESIGVQLKRAIEESNRRIEAQYRDRREYQAQRGVLAINIAAEDVQQARLEGRS